MCIHPILSITRHSTVYVNVTGHGKKSVDQVKVLEISQQTKK